MQGDRTNALIIISKARGWDPTVIPAMNGKPAESIANFDKNPTTQSMAGPDGQWAVRNGPLQQEGTPTVGKLPEAIPANSGMFPAASEPQYSGNPGIDFEVGLGDKLGPNRAGGGSDPYAGKGGF